MAKRLSKFAVFNSRGVKFAGYVSAKNSTGAKLKLRNIGLKGVRVVKQKR